MLCVIILTAVGKYVQWAFVQWAYVRSPSCQGFVSRLWWWTFDTRGHEWISKYVSSYIKFMSTMIVPVSSSNGQMTKKEIYLFVQIPLLWIWRFQHSSSHFPSFMTNNLKYSKKRIKMYKSPTKVLLLLKVSNHISIEP